MQTTRQTAPIPELERPLEDGWTLPATWYADAGVHAHERERIFSRTWTYAGPSEWVAEPGSYFAAHIGHVPVAVVRGSDGVLRGLVNVCRHRGHLVVEGTGCRETLQCPYHAWTYDLDGTLRRRPPLGARARLRPLRVVAGSRLRRHVGPVRLRQPRSRGGTARGRARRPARDRRRERARRRRDSLPLAPRVADRGELEDRHGELPRVLPLPDGASGVQQGDRRQPRLVPAAGAPHLLEPDRPGPRVRARGQRQGAVRGARRRHAVAVPLPLPVDDAEHRAGDPEHLDRALPARTVSGERWR